MTALRVVPLGGLGEFGANCMVFETEADLVLVDAGLLFADESLFGIDALAPDFAYVVERRSRLRAIVLTHGHEDHVGALPVLMRRLQVPVYGTPWTLSVAERRLEEQGLDRRQLRTFTAGQTIDAGSIRVKAVAVAHSAPQSLALVLDTPAGRIVHSGDFKIDVDPLDGTATDLPLLHEIGGAGVTALFSDSTNANRPGRSAPERSTFPALARLFDETDGRLVLATFSSHVARLSAFAAEARKRGRRLALLGRSVQANAEASERLGLLRVPAGSRLPAIDVDHPVPRFSAIVAGGCQGEHGSALSRAARAELPGLPLGEGDVVAFSSRTIPGREKHVGRVMDALLRLGVSIRDTSSDADLHVSGHAAADDLGDLVAAVRPKHLIPIHGDLRHLHAHARLVRALPDAPKATVVENGAILEFDEKGELTVLAEKAPTNRVALLGDPSEEVATTIFRERARLGAEGVVIVAARVRKGRLAGDPEVAMRGVRGDADEGLARELARALGREAFDRPLDDDTMKDELERRARRWCRKQLNSRPTVVVLLG